MKKIIAFTLCLFIIGTCGITAFAAGTDDGSISVIDKNGQKYFGTEYVNGCTEYVAANGSGDVFYDLNGDKDMDICDLVALTNGSVDFDANDVYDSADSAALRLLLIGKN